MPSTFGAKFAILRLSASNAKVILAPLSGPILVAAVLFLQQTDRSQSRHSTFIHSNTAQPCIALHNFPGFANNLHQFQNLINRKIYNFYVANTFLFICQMDMYWEDLHYIKYQNLQKKCLNTGIYIFLLAFFTKNSNCTFIRLHIYLCMLKHPQISVF